jgi:hypothetical protein
MLLGPPEQDCGQRRIGNDPPALQDRKRDGQACRRQSGAQRSVQVPGETAGEV